MSDPTIGFTPQFWLYGFISTVYTNSWQTGLALLFIVEFGYNIFAFHAADAANAAECTELLFQIGPVHCTVAVLGTLVGMMFVLATDFPNVFNLDVFFSSVQRSVYMGGYVSAPAQGANARGNDGYEGSPWRAKPYFWPMFGLVIPVAFMYAAILFFIGKFTEPVHARSISQATANAIGATLLIVGVISLVIFIWFAFAYKKSSRIPDGHIETARLTLKYLFFFVLAMATPAAFDFTYTLSASARWLIHIAVALVVYFLTAWAGTGDRYLGTESAGRVFGTFVLLWIVHLTIYAGSAFLTSQDGVFIWISAWSLGWFIVLAIAGLWRRFGTERDAKLARQDERRDRFFRDKEALLSKGSRNVALASDAVGASQISMNTGDTEGQHLRQRRSNLRSGKINKVSFY